MKNVWHETTIDPPRRHRISDCSIESCGQACTVLHTVPTDHAMVDCGEWCGCRVVDPATMAVVEGWADRARSQYRALLDAGFAQYEATAILGYWLAGRTNTDTSK